MLKYITCFTGLLAGNYIFQYFTYQNYEIAFDRTFFQAFALIAIYLIDMVDKILS